MKELIEAGSWVGMILLLVAYASKERTGKRVNAAMNLAGALLLGIKCVESRVYAGAMLEVAWIAIALRDWFAGVPRVAKASGGSV